MAVWIFEPGHTEVEFRARHMMVRVVSDHIDVVLDVEAIHEGDLDKTGAIEHYRG